MRMNKTFLSSAILTCMSATALGANSFTVFQDNAFVSNASSNGKYAVGFHPMYNDCNVYLESFMFDAEAGELDWFTFWDEDDLSLGGEFRDVSDSGVVCGTSRDLDNIITWDDPFFGDSFSGPTQVATIWENGEKMPLPYGEVDPGSFVQLSDGTFGIAITADGNLVVGKISIDNGNSTPCTWKRDEKGDWQFSYLPLPSNTANVRIAGMADSNGTIIADAYCDDSSVVIYWDGGQPHVLAGPEKTSPDEWVNLQALAISDNGRFIVMSRNLKAIIYDIKTEEYRSVEPFDEYSSISQNVAIDNNGNVYGTYAGYPANRPFVYLYESDRIFDMGYYLSAAVPDLTTEVSFEPGSQVTFNAVSADGRRLFGNTSSMMGKGWMMELDTKSLILPFAPEISYAFSRGLNEVTLRWDADTRRYEGLTLDAYNIYRNGELIETVDASTRSFDITLTGQPTGYPQYAIEGIFKGEGNSNVKSPMSNAIAVAVAADYSLPLFDDFESSVQTNYWTSSTDFGNSYDSSWSCFTGAGVGDGSGLYSSVSGKTPYSFNFISRPMDATEEDFVSVSFGFIFALLNEPVQILDKDFIAIDFSTDMGDTWTEIKSWALAEMSAGNWCFKSLDISDLVAGRIFSLRLRRHGEGVAQYMSGIDNFAVNIVDGIDAPEGLTGIRNADGSASLIWKSQSGQYGLNHLGNIRTMNMAFGNEGKEMIGANLFTEEDIAPYDGKYITSVSALINYFNWYDDVLGIKATAVVFENGEIVREQEFGEIAYNNYNVAYLDEPLLIDASKELMVGVRIHDYDDWQWPMVAAVADDYVPGKTDLYTYDNGKTWSRLSELYDVEDIQGHCIWDITADISDTADNDGIFFSDMPLLYNIYRDGALLNTISIDGNATRYIDREAPDNASYTVMAIAGDGAISNFSEPFILTSTGISSISGSTAEIRYDRSCKTIEAGDDALRVSVINLGGQLMVSGEGNSVSADGLASGIYIVNVEFSDRMESAKLIVP